MKPDSATAMRNLIAQVRLTIPFGMPEAQMCLDGCQGCSRKLLEFLESELDSWERRLDDGEIPDFGDLNALVKTSKKIYTVLNNNGLVNDE
jgi:hypothetical protein